MKVFERIFLYSVVSLLVFYVFLVDGNVESKEVIQEEIRARSIAIVDDEGQVVVSLWTSKDGGVINIANKDGITVANISANENGGAIGIFNKTGTPATSMGAAKEGNGAIE